MSQTVIIHVGLSGSGKSTMINNSINIHNTKNQSATVCSADIFFERNGSYSFDYRLLGEAHKWCQKKFQQALDDKVEWIYVDNTNLTKKERAFYLGAATKAKASIIVCAHEVNVDLSERRNIHGVPRETLERMASKVDLKDPGMYHVGSNGDGTYDYLFLRGLPQNEQTD